MTNIHMYVYIMYVYLYKQRDRQLCQIIYLYYIFPQNTPKHSVVITSASIVSLLTKLKICYIRSKYIMLV